MTNRLQDAVRKQKQNTKKHIPPIHGSLGIKLGGSKLVEVPTRNAYVYVRLRNNDSEVIQAFNNQVAPAYNLPVIVERQGNRYTVVSVDTERYENNWNSFAPYLPRHGNTHSFDLESGGGGDIVWVYPRQFTPLLVLPSGSLGAGNVVVSSYTLKKDNNSWLYTGNTGTPNIAPYRPSTGAVMVLVYLDANTGNPGLVVGSGTYFSQAITGTSAVVPYIPSVPSPTTQIPLAAVRLVTGTTQISWNNIYDVRQFLHTVPTGTGGGGGGTPGGSNTQVQYNNAGSFGGMRLDYTYNAGNGVQLTTELDGDNGDDLTFSASNGANDGDAGGIEFVAGNAPGAGIGGFFTMSAGNSDSGFGGSFSAQGGDSVDGVGGSVAFVGGNSDNAAGGDVTLRAGLGSPPGQIQFVDPTSEWPASLNMTGLSAERQYSFPDQSGVLALVGGSTSMTGTPVGLANKVVLTNGSGYIFTPSWLAWGTSSQEFIEFGADVAGKESNAGKIGYEAFGSGYLFIVGAGTGSSDRRVQVYDKLFVSDLVQASGFNITNSAQTYNITGSPHTHPLGYQIGTEVITCNSGTSNKTVTITFPTAFTSAPRVFFSAGPSGNFTSAEMPLIVRGDTLSTTQVSVFIRTVDGGNWAADRTLNLQWIAYGT